jgi:hypothetical protein
MMKAKAGRNAHTWFVGPSAATARDLARGSADPSSIDC